VGEIAPVPLATVTRVHPEFARPFALVTSAAPSGTVVGRRIIALVIGVVMIVMVGRSSTPMRTPVVASTIEPASVMLLVMISVIVFIIVPTVVVAPVILVNGRRTIFTHMWRWV